MPSSPYPSTYHPSGSDPTHAVPLEVIDGQQRRIDLRLPARLPTRRVTGVVVDEHDVPVIGASVTLTDLEFPHALSMIRATSDIVGGFEVEAFEGREYLLQVLGFTPKRSGEIRLTRGASSSGLRVVLR